MMQMTKGERDDLLRLVRQRDKVMKSQASERSAALLADFDVSMAKIYNFDDDAVWQRATDTAKAAVDAANQEVAKRCEEMGIPREFSPYLHFGWADRGHNAVAQRRSELRQAAKSRIAALEKEAISKIERFTLESQTKIVAEGLNSANAKAFLENMPKMDSLMPPIEVGEIQALIEVRQQERRKYLTCLD